MTFYLMNAIVVVLFNLLVFTAADEEFCCQYRNELHPIDAVACTPYDCTAMIKGWGQVTHKTSTDSCSSCQPITSELSEEKKSEENIKDIIDKTDRAEESMMDSDVWVQCCLYSSGPDYTDTLTYGQESSNECEKFRDNKLFIGTWWSTNKEDCFFHQSDSSTSAPGNSTALLS